MWGPKCLRRLSKVEGVGELEWWIEDGYGEKGALEGSFMSKATAQDIHINKNEEGGEVKVHFFSSHYLFFSEGFSFYPAAIVNT